MVRLVTDEGVGGGCMERKNGKPPERDLNGNEVTSSQQ